MRLLQTLVVWLFVTCSCCFTRFNCDLGRKCLLNLTLLGSVFTWKDSHLDSVWKQKRKTWTMIPASLYFSSVFFFNPNIVFSHISYSTTINGWLWWSWIKQIQLLLALSSYNKSPTPLDRLIIEIWTIWALLTTTRSLLSSWILGFLWQLLVMIIE